MISIDGRWYDSRTSAQVDAVCRIYDNGSIHVQHHSSGELLLALSRFDVKASPRLADTPRRIYFPDGEKFETTDNEAVDRAMAAFGRSSLMRFVHRIESRKRYILVALAGLLFFIWVGIRYVIPETARAIAFRLPPSVLDTASRQGLDFLDGTLFSTTELAEATQRRVLEHFRPALEDTPGYSLEVIFRKSEQLGPNALALPAGTIIFTDEMVKLAEHDDELLAVLIHEIGHVVHRHAMRRIVQDSLLGFILLSITGDISGSSELFLGLPVLLTELSYSRELEREADRYALQILPALGTPPVHFANIMRRIEKKRSLNNSSESAEWLGYLSTHPLTSERLLDFEELPSPGSVDGRE